MLPERPRLAPQGADLVALRLALGPAHDCLATSLSKDRRQVKTDTWVSRRKIEAGRPVLERGFELLLALRELRLQAFAGLAVGRDAAPLVFLLGSFNLEQEAASVLRGSDTREKVWGQLYDFSIGANQKRIVSVRGPG